MRSEEKVQELSEQVERFLRSIDELPQVLFLRKIHDWSPRDVLAHLIGWNRYTKEGCEQLRRGELPFYFGDSSNGFGTVHARSVQQYASTDRATLVPELRASLTELQQFLLMLQPDEWEADQGVRNRHNRPVTIKRQVEALAEDYEAHRREIVEWVQSTGST